MGKVDSQGADERGGYCFCGESATHRCEGEGAVTNCCLTHAEDLTRWSFEIRKMTATEKRQAKWTDQ